MSTLRLDAVLGKPGAYLKNDRGSKPITLGARLNGLEQQVTQMGSKLDTMVDMLREIITTSKENQQSLHHQQLLRRGRLEQRGMSVEEAV